MSQRIVQVQSGSLAARNGIHAGDTLISIGGTPVLDLVDYQFLTARPALEILLEDGNGAKRTVHIRKGTGDPLGLTLESSLMSCPKTCANHCIFCFIEQMPPGMRESLYVRDDDWRLSLIAGNFVTLTNLPAREMERIIERQTRVDEPGRVFRSITRDRFTIEQCVFNLTARLRKGPVLFTDMLSQQVTRDEIVTYFMAILEMLKLGKLHVEQEQAYDDILILPGRRFDEDGEEDGQSYTGFGGADAPADA